MKKILQLFKLQLDNNSSIFKTSSLKSILFSLFKLILMVTGITVALYMVLFRILVLGFVVNTQLIAVVLLVTQGVSLIFAVGDIITNMYLSKDNQLLVVLPVTPNQVFISKIMLIYINELLFSALVTLPLLLSIGIVSGMGAAFFASIPIIMVFLPILPIVVASFLSIPIMMILKFFKKHLSISIIAILTITVTVLSGYMMLVGNIAESFNIVSRQIETVNRINTSIASLGGNIIIYFQIATAMFNFSSWYWFIAMLLFSVAIIGLTIALIKPFYFKTAMSTMESGVKPIKRPKNYVPESTFLSLLRKEFYTVFRSPGYVFQYFLFTLLMPFIVFSYDKLMLSIAVSQAGQNMIAGSHVLVVAIFAMLSNIISASAISREGANFYITKITPVSYYIQMLAKMVFNAIFTIGALFVTMLVSMLYLHPGQVAIGTIAIMFASVGHIALSIDMDLKKPSLDWYANEETSKMGGTTAKSMIIGLFIALVMGFIIIAMAHNQSFVPWLIILVFGVAFGIYRIYRLVLRINWEYDKIEI